MLAIVFHLIPPPNFSTKNTAAVVYLKFVNPPVPLASLQHIRFFISGVPHLTVAQMNANARPFVTVKPSVSIIVIKHILYQFYFYLVIFRRMKQLSIRVKQLYPFP